MNDQCVYSVKSLYYDTMYYSVYLYIYYMWTRVKEIKTPGVLLRVGFFFLELKKKMKKNEKST